LFMLIGVVTLTKAAMVSAQKTILQFIAERGKSLLLRKTALTIIKLNEWVKIKNEKILTSIHRHLLFCLSLCFRAGWAR